MITGSIGNDPNSNRHHCTLSTLFTLPMTSIQSIDTFINITINNYDWLKSMLIPFQLQSIKNIYFCSQLINTLTEYWVSVLDYQWNTMTKSNFPAMFARNYILNTIFIAFNGFLTKNFMQIIAKWKWVRFYLKPPSITFLAKSIISYDIKRNKREKTWCHQALTWLHSWLVNAVFKVRAQI